MPPETPGKDPNQVKHKITVDGQEIEVTQEELISLAQQGKDYTKKMQTLGNQEKALKEQEAKVAGLKTIVDDMDADPKLKETLNKVYSDYKSGKISKSEDNKDRSLKKIDKLIEEATEPEEREKLRLIREIVKQEAPVEELEKKYQERISNLEEKISRIEETTLSGQSDRVESQIEKLEGEYGKDLVGKHKEEIKALALKYPRQEVENILLHLADKTEVRNALLEQAKKKEKEELERKRKGSSPSGSEGSFIPKTELKRDKTGKVPWESLKERILERIKK